MIRLNLATDYALRTLLLLVARPDEQLSVRAVAAFYEISSDHVSKVVQHLAQAGYVRTGRGRGGGFRLAKPADEITVGAVIELFEGPVALLDCVAVAEVCVIQSGCRLKRLLRRVGDQLMAELNAVTLAEIATPTPSALAHRLIPATSLLTALRLPSFSDLPDDGPVVPAPDALL